MKKFQTKQYISLYELIAVGITLSTQTSMNLKNIQTTAVGKLTNNLGERTIAVLKGYFKDTSTQDTYNNLYKLFMIKEENNAPALKDNIKDLLVLLSKKYNDDIVYFINEGQEIIDNYSSSYNTTNEMLLKGGELLIKIDTIIQQTYDRYSKLLTLYQNDIDDLIGTIESVETEEGQASSNAKNFFNDTPQSEDDSFDAPDYASSVSLAKNEGSNLITRRRHENREYLIDLLDKVQTKYRNILDDWSKHFEKLFILRYNISEEE